MDKITCAICYREFDPKDVIGSICFTCKRMIGKGDGYKSEMSEEAADKWMEGWEARKREYEKKQVIK